MPLSLLAPDKGPLLVRVGDAGGSGFFGLEASRGRPDQPMLLSPETTCSKALSAALVTDETQPVSLSKLAAY